MWRTHYFDHFPNGFPHGCSMLFLVRFRVNDRMCWENGDTQRCRQWKSSVGNSDCWANPAIVPLNLEWTSSDSNWDSCQMLAFTCYICYCLSCVLCCIELRCIPIPTGQYLQNLGVSRLVWFLKYVAPEHLKITTQGNVVTTEIKGVDRKLHEIFMRIRAFQLRYVVWYYHTNSTRICIIIRCDKISPWIYYQIYSFS